MQAGKWTISELLSSWRKQNPKQAVGTAQILKGA